MEDRKPIFTQDTESTSLVISIYFHWERELSHLLATTQPEPTVNYPKMMTPYHTNRLQFQTDTKQL